MSVIDSRLVERLIAEQFPPWSELPVEPVLPGGWDNRSFRLGDELSVRLPSAAGYVAQVGKEHRWLPHLAERLPLEVPESIAVGAPGCGYPWPWSVRRWIEGEDAAQGRIDDPVGLGRDLGAFLVALRSIDATGGPPPGAHNFHRGAPPAHYEPETLTALEALRGEIDTELARAIWEEGTRTTWSGPPVWLHGDVAASNLLVRDGRLAAVIDFGCLGVGDPACDLSVAWTLFQGESRAAFREAVALDDATWARARAWALWKASITVAGAPGTNPVARGAARRTLGSVLACP